MTDTLKSDAEVRALFAKVRAVFRRGSDHPRHPSANTQFRTGGLV